MYCTSFALDSDRPPKPLFDEVSALVFFLLFALPDFGEAGVLLPKPFAARTRSKRPRDTGSGQEQRLLCRSRGPGGGRLAVWALVASEGQTTALAPQKAILPSQQ
mmetsp:Transcript_1200/g.4248  ORF Transcript_1200/g.4248 Transcript_1200/m.4248 type:complete len:105 (+) Transcript_1200:2643-2957(+)